MVMFVFNIVTKASLEDAIRQWPFSTWFEKEREKKRDT